MRTFCGTALLLLALGVFTATDAAPPKKAPPNAPATLDADNLAPGNFTGTIMNTPGTDRVFTVNVAYQKLQLKPGQNLGRTNQNLQRQYNHIMQLQNQLMRGGRNRNPAGTMQQLQRAVVQFQTQLAQAQANMFQVVNATQPVDFQVEEDVKVRVLNLPEEFDDKGNIKKYTRDELVQLKGKDRNLPGYESSLENLKPGQVVQVTLRVHRKPRPAPTSPTSADKDKDANKDKDKDQTTTNEHKLQVKMIVIVKDSDGTQPTSPGGNRRNK